MSRSPQTMSGLNPAATEQHKVVPNNGLKPATKQRKVVPSTETESPMSEGYYRDMARTYWEDREQFGETDTETYTLPRW